MASMFSKIAGFARSPQGQKLIKQAQAAAKDPATRAKARKLAEQVRGRKGGTAR